MSPRERGVGDWEIMVDKVECPSILFCTHAESGDCGLKCTLSVKLPRHRDAGKQRHCRFAGVCFSGVNGFSPPAHHTCKVKINSQRGNSRFVAVQPRTLRALPLQRH